MRTITAETRFTARRVLLACLPGLLVACWFQGWGLLLHLLLTCLTGGACACLTRHKPRPPFCAAGILLSGLLIALALPAQAPWWLAVSAASFAGLFGKALYAVPGRGPLNPAMLGIAFAWVAFPAQMSQWPAQTTDRGLETAIAQVFDLGGEPADGWSQATVLDTLKHNDRFTTEELFATHPAFGHVGGQGAEWVNLAFLLAGLFLLQQRTIHWQAPVGMLGGLFAIALVSWNGSGSDSNGSPLLHLFSGATMLGAFIIANDPGSGASTARSRLCFGIGIGLLTYAIRTWGNHADGLAFAVLLMNLGVPLLERLEKRSQA